MGREAMRQVNEKQYQQYLIGDSWRCPDAPINPDFPLQVLYNTGSHHWIEFKAGKSGEFYCRYCFELRKFNLDWNGGKE